MSTTFGLIIIITAIFIIVFLRNTTILTRINVQGVDSVEEKDMKECKEGIPGMMKDITSFIPDINVLMHQRGLLAIPAGRKNVDYVLMMINATQQYFDIILFSFDNFDWSTQCLEKNVKVVQSPGGRK
jgi:hypothetical protein